jgi:N-acetylglutamate synthase-like GNAT family acetyltransferase
MPTPNSWTITPATAAGLAPILSLLSDSRLPTSGVEEMAETLVVARQDGRVIGCAGLELYGNAALLRSVAVATPARGTGLGRALTRGALDLARERRVRRVYLLEVLDILPQRISRGTYLLRLDVRELPSERPLGRATVAFEIK